MMPDFAKPIAEARLRGVRPAEMVIVSDGDHGLHWRFPASPVVRVKPDQRPSALSWRFLADLDVEIATEDCGRRLLEFVDSIEAARPNYLRVWHLATGAMTRLVFCGARSFQPEREWLCV